MRIVAGSACALLELNSSPTLASAISPCSYVQPVRLRITQYYRIGRHMVTQASEIIRDFVRRGAVMTIITAMR